MQPVWNLKAHERNEVYFVIFVITTPGRIKRDPNKSGQHRGILNTKYHTFAKRTYLFHHQIVPVESALTRQSTLPKWQSAGGFEWGLFPPSIKTNSRKSLPWRAKTLYAKFNEFSRHVDVYFGNLFCHCRCLSNAMLLTYAKHSRKSSFTKQKTLRYAPCFICDEALQTP